MIFWSVDVIKLTVEMCKTIKLFVFYVYSVVFQTSFITVCDFVSGNTRMNSNKEIVLFGGFFKEIVLFGGFFFSLR